MGEISNSLAEMVRSRVASATIGTYLFFWSAFHWEGLYTGLFVDEHLIYAKYHLLKNEYLNHYFFGWHGLSHASTPFVEGLLWPILLTFLFIWILPELLLIHFYRKEQRFRVAKHNVKIEEEKRLMQKKESLARQTSRTLQAQVQVETERQNIAKKDPRVLWNQEFVEFAHLKDFKWFPDILKSVYKYNGQTHVEKYGFTEFQLDPHARRVGDVHGIIKSAGTTAKISLTTKGKEFAKLYDGDF
ncbi:MAG TPA: hypothetical protein VFI74_05930 [Candidatus Saccharimonadales bacterium]|nr:hypothetical protein [Candidatus Saccharimonadales bacterium]